MIQFIETVSQGIFNRQHIRTAHMRREPESVRIAFLGNEQLFLTGNEAKAFWDGNRTMPGICEIGNVLINLIWITRITKSENKLIVRFVDDSSLEETGKEANEIYDAILKLKAIYDGQMQAMTELMRQQSERQNLVQPASNFPGAFRK